ncbi:hypothetical protein MIND_01272400 [Mycena indigotica]|uniref:DUF6535 domain-containing protein n=1 Tax=Mycena indigotica TaxID=2126181 RepID=A0A8H6S2Z3_9AGAR|nr:uncharacterized protein MIND_01272400 [Mycena indigotica]KAF7291285.1 hypothetical protein MIND_01272400 [Mycena indigotica]
MSARDVVDTPALLLQLLDAVQEQVEILRRVDHRQLTSDLSKQPMPEVPATSSSAWNALLKSTLAETIQPKVDRWRSGLDALLVFLGLFSAIVTSFFVQSLLSLQEDQSMRMNELVANLTEIIIVISGVPPATLGIKPPRPFKPAGADVRLNAYWSLSLILSLSIAALAVACRGYLNMVGWSRFIKASERLIDIRTRWLAFEPLLGPTIELLPQMLVIPVLLFIIGLLDTLFSSVLQLSPIPIPILFTAGLSLLFIVAVALLLAYTVVDRDINPTGTGIVFRLMSEVRTWMAGPHTTLTLARNNTRQPRVSTKSDIELPSTAHLVYHDVVQSTHDDETLNEAAAALYSVIQSFSVWPRYTMSANVKTSSGLLAQERATLLHLLSPEASARSNRTAVQVILRIQDTNRIRYSQNDMAELIPVLLDAARRSLPSNTAETHVRLWESPFVHAMAIVSNAGAFCGLPGPRCAPALAFLASEYIDIQRLPSDIDPSVEHALRTRTIGAIAELLYSSVAKLVHDNSALELSELDSAVSSLLESPLEPASTYRSRSNSSSESSTISTGLPLARQPLLLNIENLLGGFIYLPLPFRTISSHNSPSRGHSFAEPVKTQSELVLVLLLRWLVHRTSSFSVIKAAQGHIARVAQSDSWPTVLFFVVSTLARTLLDWNVGPSIESTSEANDNETQDNETAKSYRDQEERRWLLPLAYLCVTSLGRIAALHQFHPQLPALMTAAADAVTWYSSFPQINDPGHRISAYDAELLQLIQAELDGIRNFVTDGTWRWSAKQREAVLKELGRLEQGLSLISPQLTTLPEP